MKGSLCVDDEEEPNDGEYKKELFPVLGEFGGGWWPATRLPRASQTCSIGFMSGEHVGHSIHTIPSSKRKSSTKLARCGLQLSSIKMKSSPIAAAQGTTIGLSILSLYRRAVRGPSRMM
ncbi:hypothetical protein TNCV_1931601 [Trichonephila clavipes]|nr:hypothetical protein TNCV_1931601 [Trichonephila clavipes]